MLRTATPAATLRSPLGELEATFVPGSGMLAASLRHRGEELLGPERRLTLRGYCSCDVSVLAVEPSDALKPSLSSADCSEPS
jgi:hypothetical protein